MTSSSAAGVIGVLWRGEREDRRPSESRRLAALFDAFEELGVEIVPLPFDDTRVEEVRSQCERLDGLLAWVNPILGLELTDLPVVWDADFLYGPKDASGKDTYVLCEINVSAVWPFPPMAAPTAAANAVARTNECRNR